VLKLSSLLTDDDFDTAVFLAPLRIVRAIGLRVGRDGVLGAEAPCAELHVFQALLFDEPILDRVGAPIRKFLVVWLQTFSIGMPFDTHRALGLVSDDVGGLL